MKICFLPPIEFPELKDWEFLPNAPFCVVQFDISPREKIPLRTQINIPD
jgi:hypothetical protein